MKFDLFINVTLRDRNGKVIKRIRRKANSYVRGMIDVLRTQMSQIGTSFVDTGGVSRVSTTNSLNFWTNAGAGVSYNGIVVGTGTNILTISDYALYSQIAHGSGSGQLNYGSCSVGVPSTVGTSRMFTVTRTFTNNSGASITVNEVGLVVGCNDDVPTNRYVLADRTRITFSIPNGASGTVTYTIKVTV